MRGSLSITELRSALRKGASNANWRATRALCSLPRGVDPLLVKRGLALVLPLSPQVVCKTMRDEYLPIAFEMLRGLKTADATFLTAFAEHGDATVLRRAAAWVDKLNTVYPDKPRLARSRLEMLIRDADAVRAAQTVVVLHADRAGKYLGILSCEGSRDSLDALLVALNQATDTTLDELARWVEPFARTADALQAARMVREAVDARSKRSTLAAFARQTFDLDETVFRVALTVTGADRRQSLSLDLDSTRRPEVKIFVTQQHRGDFRAYSWADGREHVRNDLRLCAPKGHAELPEFMQRSARQLDCSWALPPLVFKSTSLRGRARRRFLDWLLGPNRPL